MSFYIVKKAEAPFSGAVLCEDETMGFDANDWRLFDTATEAILASFGLPFPAEVHIVGADRDSIANQQTQQLN